MNLFKTPQGKGEVLLLGFAVWIVTCFSGGTASSALAQEDWSSLDINEHLMGATNVHAIAGNGGLSVGFSAQGELTVLTYPSPSYTDQLAYVTSNHPDARKQPYFGAKESMGAFFGLRYRSGSAENFTWLRGEGRTSTVGYAAEDAPVPVTMLRHETLGITVTLTDLVLPEADVLARNVSIALDADSSIEPIALVAYANLSPTLSRVPKLPIVDWALEPHHDYAAVYDAERDAILHFKPGDTGLVESLIDLFSPPANDYGPIGDLLKSATVEAAAVEAIASDPDSRYSEGVYVAMGAAETRVGRNVQIGFDTTDFCASIDELGDNILLIPERFPEADPMDLSALDMLRCTKHALDSILEREGWMYSAEDAYTDAADGLSGSRIAAGQVNTAMELPLENSGGSFSSTFYFAFGAKGKDAYKALDEARSLGFEKHLENTLSHWKARIDPLRLPDSDDSELLAFCKRTLVNLLVGTDRNTGAIVASLSRQPAYGEDWPRDGAFFNAALDAAGLHDLVTQRLLKYAQWQRKEPSAAEPIIDPAPPPDPDDPSTLMYPAGAWEMNYFADGMTGGFIRFEIDNTAFLLWNYAYHAGYIEDESAREQYLNDVWPTVKDAADLLTRWRDASTGLPAPANENDNPAYTATLFGAGPIFAALNGATKISRQLGHEDDAIKYENRASELRQAIQTHLIDEDTGFLLERRNISGHPGSNLHAASSTAIWPGRLLDFADANTRLQMETNLDDVLEALRGETDGGSYLNKVTLTAALALAGTDSFTEVEEALGYLVHELPTAGTLHYGEVFLVRDGTYDQRVANPHLWAASLTYLTAMAATRPELFDRHLCVLPETAVDTPFDCSENPSVGGDEDSDRKKGKNGCRNVVAQGLFFFFLVGVFLIVRFGRRFYGV